MTAEQLQRFVNRLADVRNTDDLYDLEQRAGPFDEEDPIAAQALFDLAAVRCRLARGPAPSRAEFVLVRPPPAHVRERFEVRGRMEARIVRVGWADGVLYGSLHAIMRLECGQACFADAASTRQRVIALFDVVIDEVRTRAVA